MLQYATSQRLYYSCLYLTAFLIPYPFVCSAIGIIAISLTWALTLDVKRTFSQLRDRKLLMLFIAFFLLHAASYFYSSDKEQSLFDLQTKMSFVVLPVVLGTGLPMGKRQLEQVFAAFVAGLVSVASFFLIRSGFRWSVAKDINVFFYHSLIEGLSANAVYYALYTFLGITALLLLDWKTTILVKRLPRAVALVILTVFFILLSSKTLLLLMLVLLGPLYLRKKLSGNKRTGYAAVAIVLLAAGVIFFTQNPIHRRYSDLFEHTDTRDWEPEYSNEQQQHFNNLTLRLFLWQTALQNIQSHNLWMAGCGNGGVTELQKIEITKYGSDNKLLNVDPPLWKYNIHNMYIQTLMMLGLPGLLILLYLVGNPFFMDSTVPEKFVIRFFSISMAIFMIQESALQTQAGIVFFTFFSVLFCNYIFSQKIAFKSQ